MRNLESLIEQPVDCRPDYLNGPMEFGYESISEHLIHHGIPKHTVEVLTVDERYLLHDELHAKEYGTTTKYNCTGNNSMPISPLLEFLNREK